MQLPHSGPAENSTPPCQNFRASIAVLAAIFILSALISVAIAGKKGELGSRYYEIITSHENETTTWAYLRYINPHPNPVYVKFLNKYSSTGSLAVYGIPLKLGAPFFKVVVYFTLLLHFLFGFGFACIIYGLFRDPKLALASTFLAYGIQSYYQVYSCHPWESSMAMAVVPLIFASFGLLMLNKHRLSLLLLLIIAPIHLTWFFPTLPVYLALFFHQRIQRNPPLAKAIPWLLFLYPIALTAAIHLKITHGIGFSREDWTIYWNLVTMRANHTILFGKGYYKLFSYIAMAIACPILAQLPGSKKNPRLHTMTMTIFYLCLGYLIVQILGNEFRLSIAANATTPLRIETFLYFLMLFHLIADALDQDSPANARLFALLMLSAFLLSWTLTFSFVPICMPLWALLQARLNKTPDFSSRANLLKITLAMSVIAILNSRAILPEYILSPQFNISSRIPRINLNILMTPAPYITWCHIIVFIAFALLAALPTIFKRLNKPLPQSTRGIQTTALALAIFSAGAYWLARPHDPAYANKPISAVSREIRRYLSGKPPGPTSWAQAIQWINSNIDRRDIIFVHPDISLNLLTQHTTSMDWGETNLFFYVPSLFRDINKNLQEIYRIDTLSPNIRRQGQMYPNLLAGYPLARVRAYFNVIPGRRYNWIIEPAGAPPFKYKTSNTIQLVSPVFQNSAIRIYKIPPRPDPRSP